MIFEDSCLPIIHFESIRTLQRVFSQWSGGQNGELENCVSHGVKSRKIGQKKDNNYRTIHTVFSKFKNENHVERENTCLLVTRQIFI